MTFEFNIMHTTVHDALTARHSITTTGGPACMHGAPPCITDKLRRKHAWRCDHVPPPPPTLSLSTLADAFGTAGTILLQTRARLACTDRNTNG